MIILYSNYTMFIIILIFNSADLPNSLDDFAKLHKCKWSFMIGIEITEYIE